MGDDESKRGCEDVDAAQVLRCQSHSELLISKVTEERRARVKADSTIICRISEMDDLIHALRARAESNFKDIGSLYIMFSVTFTLAACEFVVLMWMFFQMIG